MASSHSNNRRASSGAGLSGSAGSPGTRVHNEMEYRELLAEYQALQKKLDGKVEALLLVSEELAKCQTDRDQWRHKSETLHHQIIQLEGNYNRHKRDWTEQESSVSQERESLLSVLNGLKKENRYLQDENNSLRQQIKESKGDIKVLRQQLARLQLAQENFEDFATPPLRGSVSSSFDYEDKSGHRDLTSSVPRKVQPSRSDSIPVDTSLEEIEKLREQCAQMDRDLRSVLCEKEELVSDRETYKTKCERLSQELTFIMTGDEKKVVTDLDSILAENRYLKAQLENAQEETGLAKQALNKYRTLFDKRRAQRTNSGEFVLPAGQSASTTTTSQPTSSKSSLSSHPTVVTPKQVRELLGDSATDTTDYRALATALFEAVNDKNLALTHQRKINKVLGTRLTELEARLRNFEDRSPARMIPPPCPTPDTAEPADPINTTKKSLAPEHPS